MLKFSRIMFISSVGVDLFNQFELNLDSWIKAKGGWFAGWSFKITHFMCDYLSVLVVI